MQQKNVNVKTTCYHCGSICLAELVVKNEQTFCCNGCNTVYEILNSNGLCNYYDLNNTPGQVTTKIRTDKFLFLDDKEIAKKLLQYTNGTQSKVCFYLPQIHCSSCLWLLENLHSLNKGVVNAIVNFSEKEITISYLEEETSLRKIVETLASIGYEPNINLQNIDSKTVLKKLDRSRWAKIGVAGFCFANIMMMSLADYLINGVSIEYKLVIFFRAATLLLSLPVLFYAATEFFKMAWHGLKNNYLNIDLPVAIALVITFVRSLFEILSGTGSGYLDSMSGIVFFMLIGRWLQNRTYQSISFDRDYKSFFPISVSVIKNEKISICEINNVKVNDIIQIHNNELVPVDGILSKGNAIIDYGFVSGESNPVNIEIGALIYAGGKQVGGAIEILVSKEVSQSYLTKLWNNPAFNKKTANFKSNYDAIGKYFTYAVLIIGAIAGIIWYTKGETKLMWNAITTVLIVACPCALLLSQNFTTGNLLRIFGHHKFYLRNAEVLEILSKINHIVFDKTGTLTEVDEAMVRYEGENLNTETKKYIGSILKQSAHPYSKAIFNYLNIKELIDVNHFKENIGQGLEAWIDDHYLKIGSNKALNFINNKNASKVYIEIDGTLLGYFSIANKYRFGVSQLIATLKSKYTLSLISGDNDKELKNIENILGVDSEIYFNKTPMQKLDYIHNLQSKHQRTVMMIGDGLNDAGALKQSDIGIAVADDNNNFTPAADAIINGAQLVHLNKFLDLAKASKKIIIITFCLSAIYNIAGLYFAVQGILQPVIAAILMPLSSITIIVLSYGLTNIAAKKYLKF